MATGDAALAAGMTIMSGSELASTLDTEMNYTRDQIANRTSAVTSVAKGGTGATTAASARTNLGLSLPLAIASGGTGATSGAAAVTAIGAAAASHTHVPLNIASGTFGGGNYVFPGNVVVPNATAATSGYVVAYINGDGRLSAGASSLRYKDLLDDPDVLTLGGIFPQLREFSMKEDDEHKPILGYIAEDLARRKDLKRFVVRRDGKVESIDFIQLLLAQVANLNARLEALEAR